jgi:hypothetical protein
VYVDYDDAHKKADAVRTHAPANGLLGGSRGLSRAGVQAERILDLPIRLARTVTEIEQVVWCSKGKQRQLRIE